MTESAPETPGQGEPTAAAPKRFLFLRKKADASADTGGTTPPSTEETVAVETDVVADSTGERVRPGVLRRRRRQLLGTYEQAIFDLGGLAMELHSRGLLAEAVLRRRAAEVADLRAQVDDLGARLDEIRQARQERRQAGRGNTVTCPSCGARSRSGANFCATCGAPLAPAIDAAVAEAEAAAAEQPTGVIIEEQVTSVIIEAPAPVEHTQAIPPQRADGDAG